MPIRLLYLITLAMSVCCAQAPSSQAEFEAAAIKPCGKDARDGGTQPPAHGRFNSGCMPLDRMIQLVYGPVGTTGKLDMRRLPLINAPAWLGSDRYEISAKAEGDAGLKQMIGPMMRALLEDRCKLKVHRETRELPVYTLTVAKSGLKIQQTKEGDCVPIDLDHLPSPEPGKPMPKYCGNRSMRSVNGSSFVVETSGTTISDFAATMLTNRLDRPVLDQTGLTGMYDLRLEFAMDREMPSGAGAARAESGATAAAPPPAGPSIFTALQEQLGLKLSSGKGPVEVLVIDHIERPSEN